MPDFNDLEPMERILLTGRSWSTIARTTIDRIGERTPENRQRTIDKFVEMAIYQDLKNAIFPTFPKRG